MKRLNKSKSIVPILPSGVPLWDHIDLLSIPLKGPPIGPGLGASLWQLGALLEHLRHDCVGEHAGLRASDFSELSSREE